MKRNQLLPLVMLVVVALFALFSRRSNTPPVTVNHPATNTPGDSRSAARPDSPAGESHESTSRRRGNHSRADQQPGVFDFYLLTLSWSPEFCATHPGKPECAAHPGFVLHGLWPQNSDGTYPENCSDAPGPSNPGAYSDILPDAGLLAHEWQTHGTCSGLAPDPYFTLARQAVHEVKIPPTLSGITQPTSMTPTAILSSFAQQNPSFPALSLALSCGNNYLTAVEVCLSKSLAPIACSDVRSCGATTVRIVPPGASSNGSAAY